jgi:hypothetical protein
MATSLPADTVMTFLLDSKNVFGYLTEAGLWTEGQLYDILEPKPGKNFNLRIRGGDRDLLIKQESCGVNGEARGELLQESWFYHLLETHSGLKPLLAHITQPLHFDAENAILIFPYLSDVCDLSDFYDDFQQASQQREQSPVKQPLEHPRALPTVIATAMGGTFARLHGQTFQKSACRDFWLAQYETVRNRARSSQSAAPQSAAFQSAAPRLDLKVDLTTGPEHSGAADFLMPDFLVGLRRLTPEIFAAVPSDALKFFRFYQRYPQIGAAIKTLNRDFDPCCVIHDDPRFANFLLMDAASLTAKLSNRSSELPRQARLQLIDWEKWKWGDPAYELGKVVANYLNLWLQSLPVSANMDLADALNQASLPLAAVQPSTGALVEAYLGNFPQILTHQPDFLVRLTQFAGLGLIRQVQIYISQKSPVGNIEMAMAQVAKSLLCQPEASISTVLGRSRADLEEVVKLAKKAQEVKR